MMNRFYKSLVIILALAMPFTASASGKPGDLDANGVVDVTDVTELLALVLYGSGDADFAVADVDRSGTVDIGDVTLLIGYVLGTLDLPDAELEFTVNDVSFVMVPVEGGTFSMGATAEQGSDGIDRELPVHEVTLSSFYIAQTEVTQALWQAVMGDNPSHFTGDLLPVENVSWNDCQQFVAALNDLTGQKFRLPTEAEWEFAARGGNESEGFKYAGSNNLPTVGWYSYNDSWQLRGTGAYGTHPVATRNPNELMLYDMSGNVHEWCQDWFGNYSTGAQTNPTGPVSGTSRVYRGGSWYFDEWFCRVSFRNGVVPTYRSYGIGLRLALD
jgi:formylglycine-generating enzyme required for sulfatase activity